MDFERHLDLVALIYGATLIVDGYLYRRVRRRRRTAPPGNGSDRRTAPERSTEVHRSGACEEAANDPELAHANIAENMMGCLVAVERFFELGLMVIIGSIVSAHGRELIEWSEAWPGPFSVCRRTPARQHSFSYWLVDGSPPAFTVGVARAAWRQRLLLSSLLARKRGVRRRWQDYADNLVGHRNFSTWRERYGVARSLCRKKRLSGLHTNALPHSPGRLVEPVRKDVVICAGRQCRSVQKAHYPLLDASFR